MIIPTTIVDRNVSNVVNSIEIDYEGCSHLLNRAGVSEDYTASLTIHALSRWPIWITYRDKLMQGNTLGRFDHRNNTISLSIGDLREYDDTNPADFNIYNQTLLHELGHSVDHYYGRTPRLPKIKRLGRSLITVSGLSAGTVGIPAAMYAETHDMITTGLSTVGGFMISAIGTAYLLNRYLAPFIEDKEVGEVSADEFAHKHEGTYPNLIQVTTSNAVAKVGSFIKN